MENGSKMYTDGIQRTGADYSSAALQYSWELVGTAHLIEIKTEKRLRIAKKIAGTYGQNQRS